MVAYHQSSLRPGSNAAGVPCLDGDEASRSARQPHASLLPYKKRRDNALQCATAVASRS
jgi:hypothetical protein